MLRGSTARLSHSICTVSWWKTLSDYLVLVIRGKAERQGCMVGLRAWQALKAASPCAWVNLVGLQKLVNFAQATSPSLRFHLIYLTIGTSDISWFYDTHVIAILSCISQVFDIQRNRFAFAQSVGIMVKTSTIVTISVGTVVTGLLGQFCN